MIEIKETDNTPDETLALQAKSDSEVFGILYQRHVNKVHAFVLARIQGKEEEARDLTSEIFIRVFTHLHQYSPRPDKPFTVWFYSVARSVVFNWHRSQSRHQKLHLFDTSRHVNNSVESEPLDVAIKHEEREELRKVIAKQPPRIQRFIFLKYVCELPNAKIAKMMGKSEGAVKALLHRTKGHLREELTQHIPSPIANGDGVFF